jgi:hypothetical protein
MQNDNMELAGADDATSPDMVRNRNIYQVVKIMQKTHGSHVDMPLGRAL